MVHYKRVGAYRNWNIWQADRKADFAGSMRLELEVKEVDEPGVKSEIEECMRSQMAAFQVSIEGGRRPRYRRGTSTAARRVAIPMPHRRRLEKT